MARPPQKIRHILSLAMARAIGVHGIALAVGLTAIFLWLYYSTGNVALAQTAALVTWLLGHILLALNMKQRRLSLLKEGMLTNRFGALWLAFMIGLTLAMTCVPALYPYLQTTPLPLYVWVAVIAVAIASTFWMDAVKLARLRRSEGTACQR